MSEGKNPHKLKRVFIKEEFVALTGNVVQAVILAQLEYWQERVYEYDEFIREERKRVAQGLAKRSDKPEDWSPSNLEETHGWIYKSAEQLSEETMLGLSASNMRKHLKALVENKWVLERTNPKHAWDRTKQYRLDLAQMKRDLAAIGYPLQEWDLPADQEPHAVENAFSKTENGGHKLETPFSKTENRTARNRKAIPETTTETTTENKTPPSEETAAAVTADRFISQLAEKLQDSVVPLTSSRKARYGKEFKDALKSGRTVAELDEAVARIVERWEDIQLALDGAIRDCQRGVSGRNKPTGKRSPVSESKIMPNDYQRTPEDIEYERQRDIRMGIVDPETGEDIPIEGMEDMPGYGGYSGFSK